MKFTCLHQSFLSLQHFEGMADQLTQLKYDEDIEFVFCDSFGMNEVKCLEIEPEMIADLKSGQLSV